MTRQIKQGWIGTVLLSMLVLGTACMPALRADGGASDGRDNATDVGSVPNAQLTNVYIDEIDLVVMESFPVQVAALMRGHLSNGCVVLDGFSATRSDEGFAIEVATHKEGDFCTQALVPFEERVTLDVLGLPAGTYTVRAGDAASEFTLAVDNQRLPEGQPDEGTPDEDTSGEDTSPADTAMETVQDLHGTVTGIEIGADGLQVALTDGQNVYSVTISVMQAEVHGRWEEIQPGAELEVSGHVMPEMQPALVIAQKVIVVGSDSDYVRNLRATVTGVEQGPTGFRAEIRAEDGTDYRVTFDPATSEIVYLGERSELQVGTPVRVSGELFRLLEAQFAPRIAAEVTVVQPAPQAGTIESDPPSDAG